MIGQIDNIIKQKTIVIIDNKKLTKGILDESGKKINKFYQERLKYFNEFRYELERNSRIIEQRDYLLLLDILKMIQTKIKPR